MTPPELAELLSRKPIVETYQNSLAGPAGWISSRWWAGQRILVGGSIINADDWKHLQEAYGVTHVLSVESERSDFGKVPPDRLCWLPTNDDGAMKDPPLFATAIAYGKAVLAMPSTVLHIHCQMGVSRSPAVAYGIRRAVYGDSHDQVISHFRTVYPGWGDQPAQQAYVTCALTALGLH